MAEADLSGRVGALEAVVRQIGDTQRQMVDLLTRVVVMEERQTTDRARLSAIEHAVHDNAKGVAAVSPWLGVTKMMAGAVVTALGTSIAAYIAIRFGMPVH